MGREIKRVPLDFDAPLDKGWAGYDMPEDLYGITCDACGGRGYSPRALHLHELWYGNAPFNPEDNDSTPLTAETPAVRAFAERNVANAPDFYGTSELAIQREGRRLARLWNGQWSHHLNAQDVADMLADGCLRELTHRWTRENGWQPTDPPTVPTVEQVNEASISSFMVVGSSEMYAVMKAKCAREGVSLTCETCGGEGHTFRDAGHKAAYDSWERVEPPEGEGWQLWQTVSDGPISPVFADADGLIEWMTTPAAKWGAVGPWTHEQAAAFVQGPGWAPSFIGTAAGIVDGVTAVAAEAMGDQA